MRISPPTLPALLLAVLAGCSTSGAAEPLPLPPTSAITWTDMDGCIRTIPMPGERVDLRRARDAEGNIVCVETYGGVADGAWPVVDFVQSSGDRPALAITPPQPAGVASAPVAANVAPSASSQPTARPIPPAQASAASATTPIATPAVTTNTTPRVVVSSEVSGFIVQVAAFGVPANLNRTQDRFEMTGFPVLTKATAFQGKPVTLLRLGPFPSRESADTALAIVRAAGFADAYLIAPKN